MMLFKKIVGAQGLTFGVVDGVITVLGILAGLYVLGDRMAVVAGMLVAGLADSFANAVGIHISQETEGKHSSKEVMMSTSLAFLATFIVTLILVVPHFFMPLQNASFVSVALGLVFITGVGYFIGKRLEKGHLKTGKLIAEYLMMTILVIAASYIIVTLVRDIFGVVYV